MTPRPSNDVLETADGRRFGYLRRGAGEPLLLIQGMAGHHEMWGEEFLGPLAGSFDVVAFDHRGIGRGDRVDSPFSTADLADDAAAVLTALGWADAHVFGISLGGMTAQQLAIRHPQRVRRLVIGCSWAGGPDGVMGESTHRFVAATATRNPEHSVRTGFEANFSHAYRDLPGSYERFESRSLAVKVPVPVALEQYQAALGHDATADLPAVEVPTMLLHGTDDAMLPLANAHHLASLMPAARLELFEGAGHHFWWEDPLRTVDLLVRQGANLPGTG